MEFLLKKREKTDVVALYKQLISFLEDIVSKNKWSRDKRFSFISANFPDFKFQAYVQKDVGVVLWFKKHDTLPLWLIENFVIRGGPAMTVPGFMSHYNKRFPKEKAFSTTKTIDLFWWVSQESHLVDFFEAYDRYSKVYKKPPIFNLLEER